MSQFYNNNLRKLFFVMKVLEMCLPYVKSYFQTHQSVKFLFSLGLKILGFFRFWKCWFEKVQEPQFQNKRFQKTFFALKVSSMYLCHVKSIFNYISEVFLSLGPKNIQTFSLMLVLNRERSNIKDLFPLRKKVFSAAPLKCLFLWLK